MPYELLSWSFFVWNGISRTASGLLYWIWNKIFGNTICCEAFVADDYQTTAWKRNKVDLSTASLWNTCKIALKNVLWILHEKEGNTERLFLTFYSLMTYLSALGLANCFFKYCTVFLFFSLVCALVLCACCVLQELHKALLTVTSSLCCKSLFLLITLCSLLLADYCLS